MIKKYYKGRKLSKSSNILYVLPLVIGLMIFKFFPLINITITSFKEGFSFLTSDYHSIGFENYSHVLREEHFWQGISNGFIFTFASSILSLFFSMIIAWCLFNVKSFFSKIFQFIIFLPFITSDIITGAVWRLLFSDVGFINSTLSSFGIEPVGWLTSDISSLITLIIFGIWDALPFSVLVVYCSFLNIDSKIFIVAQTNGASNIKVLTKIVIPMIRPTIVTMLIFNITKGWLEINALFSLFLGEPGPYNNLYLPVYYIYEQLHFEKKFVYACVGSILLLICIIVSLLLPVFIKKLIVRRGKNDKKNK